MVVRQEKLTLNALSERDSDGGERWRSAMLAGEIDPFFGGNQILVAYAVKWQPLGSLGPAQIVAPGDKAGGRFVHNIAKIIVEAESK